MAEKAEAANNKLNEKIDKSLEKMKEQWKVMARKAFFDLLKERVESNPPDYDWITKLYTEIR